MNHNSNGATITMTYDAVNDLLSSGGPPSFKFDAIGDTVRGTIVNVEKTQQTDFKTGELKTFSNGDPMWQFVLTLQTDLRDPANPDDDGLRRVFAKGNMFKVVRDAISAHKPTPQQVIGGTIAIQHNGLGQPSAVGLNPPKLFIAQFSPNPAPGSNVADLIGTPAPAAAQPMAAPAAAPAPLV